MIDLALEQVISQIIAFLIMLGVLKIFFWKPLLGIMEERKRVITAEFAHIEQQKNENKQLSADYQSKLKEIETLSRKKLNEAVEKGQKIALDIEVAAREDATQILNQAKEEVNREILQAKVQLKSDIVKISLSAVEKLINESLTNEMHKKIVNEAIEQIDAK